MQDKVRLAGPDGAVGTALARGTVGRADPAHPVLPRARMLVRLGLAGLLGAELAGRTLRRAGACRPALDAVACPREHGRPAVALHEWPHQPIEVLTACVADRWRCAVGGAATRPLHFVAGPLPRHVRRRLTELSRGACTRGRRITEGASVEDAAAGGHKAGAAGTVRAGRAGRTRVRAHANRRR